MVTERKGWIRGLPWWKRPFHRCCASSYELGIVVEGWTRMVIMGRHDLGIQTQEWGSYKTDLCLRFCGDCGRVFITEEVGEVEMREELMVLLNAYLAGTKDLRDCAEWLAGVDWDDPALGAGIREDISLLQLLQTEVAEGLRAEHEFREAASDLILHRKEENN